MGSLDGIGPVEKESVSNVTLVNSVQLGTRKTVNAVDYIYVYNNGNTQISTGQMANIQAASMNSGYSVIVSCAVSGATGTWNVVGVCYHNTMATATYGWLVTRGLCFGVPDSGQISANSGDLLTCGNDGGFVSYAVSAGTGLLKAQALAVCLNSFITAQTAAGSVYNRIFFKSPLFG